MPFDCSSSCSLLFYYFYDNQNFIFRMFALNVCLTRSAELDIIRSMWLAGCDNNGYVYFCFFV